jgi:hypothetical protein
MVFKWVCRSVLSFDIGVCCPMVELKTDHNEEPSCRDPGGSWHQQRETRMTVSEPFNGGVGRGAPSQSLIKKDQNVTATAR